MAHIIIDIALVCIVVFCVVRGSKRGLAKTILGILGVVVAYAGAAWIASHYYEEFTPILSAWLEKNASKLGEGSELEVFASVAGAAGTSISAYLSGKLSYCAVYLISFVGLGLVWGVAARIIASVFRLPGLHTVNSFGGAIAGLAYGLIFMLAAAWLLRYISDLLPAGAVESSVVLQLVNNMLAQYFKL